MARTIVGLEINEACVRAVELSRGKRPALIAAGEVPLPPGAAKDSEVLDTDAVAMAVTQLWSQAGIKGKEVVVGVANRRILVREHSTPAIRPDLMRAALPFDVQDLLPVPPEQAVLDFYPIAESEGQVHGLLVAAVSETIEGLISALNRARIRTAAVDFIPFGLARVAKLVAPEQTVAVVAIGEHTTNFIIAQDGIPRFARIIPLDLGLDAAVDLTEQPVEAVPEQLPHARRAVDAAPADTAAPAVADLIGRVRTTLSFHASRPGASPVSAVFLTGAGVGAPGLLQLASATVGAPVFTVDVNSLAAAGRGTPPPGRFAASLVTTLGIILGEER
ncbi:MAG: pilus assembly protein PilM [Actinobacteria bacterium]|nr:pilus assembly protein PilM [Actinomycetota bacterium]